MFAAFALSLWLEFAGQDLSDQQLLKKAVEFRRFVSSEVRPGRQGIQLDGPLIKRTLLTHYPDDWARRLVELEFEDSEVFVNPVNGRVSGLRIKRDYQEPWDPPWRNITDLSEREFTALCAKFLNKADWDFKFRITQVERWGGDGFPNGPRRFWRIAACFMYGPVPSSISLITFEIDANTLQLLNISVPNEISAPLRLKPSISPEAALQIVATHYLSKDPKSEVMVSQVEPNEFRLCVFDPRFDPQEILAHEPEEIKAAFYAHKAILCYRIWCEDVSWYGAPHGPVMSALIDAQTGKGYHFGEPNSWPDQTSARPAAPRLTQPWGPGQVSICYGRKLISPPNAEIKPIDKPSHLGPARKVMMRIGYVTFLAYFHPDLNLLSRQFHGKEYYGKPSETLLARLQRLPPL
jgi:hypothetical protein